MKRSFHVGVELIYKYRNVEFTNADTENIAGSASSKIKVHGYTFIFSGKFVKGNNFVTYFLCPLMKTSK